MTAHPIIKMLDPSCHAEAERCLRALLEWHSESLMRRKIIDTYRGGWCDAEFCLQTLIGLDIIEYTPEVTADG